MEFPTAAVNPGGVQPSPPPESSAQQCDHTGASNCAASGPRECPDSTANAGKIREVVYVLWILACEGVKVYVLLRAVCEEVEER